jgi:four helix bundle protein
MKDEPGGKNEKVDLRQRTKDFALRVIRMFASLPKTAVAETLGRQVLRSGTAVGANYREAFRARSKAEFMSKCGDSLRELEESAYWLELLVDAGIVDSEQLSPLLSRMRRIDRNLRSDHETYQTEVSSPSIGLPNSYFRSRVSVRSPRIFRRARGVAGQDRVQCSESRSRTVPGTA